MVIHHILVRTCMHTCTCECILCVGECDIHVSTHGTYMYMYVHACLYVCELCVNIVSLCGEYSVLHLVTIDLLHGGIKKER